MQVEMAIESIPLHLSVVLDTKASRKTLWYVINSFHLHLQSHYIIMFKFH